ncbi:MAG: arylsulfatase [Bacteroidota bacterium]
MPIRTKSRIRNLLIVFLGSLSLSGAPPSSSLPNVVIILADDLGYGDLQSYNSASLILTPNLDRLAEKGIRLTNAYCPVAVCSPSRYSLMTGRYSFRSWKKNGVMANYEPSLIEDGIVTLPEMLQNTGYTTAGFGKWHLGTTFPTLDKKKPAGYGKFRADSNGANLDLSKPVTDGPLDHGFDYWLGFSCASECWILENNKVAAVIDHDLYTTEATPNAEKLPKYMLEEYTPFITGHTLEFLKKQASTNAPFFLYFAPYVPHIPLAVSEPFQNTTEAGLYGDYVHELDYYVGKILDALDSLAFTDNTIVLFASDNGSQFTMTAKGMSLENAQNNPDTQLEGQSYDKVHHPNGKLRGTKWTVWEGGVRTPFIARWPNHFSAGSVSRDLFALNDVLATLAAVVDYDLPENSAQDSYNLLPLLLGEGEGIRKSVIVKASNNTYGLRQGKWKYVEGENDQPPQLYDLSVDEAETNDVLPEHPVVAQEMAKQLAEILNSGQTVTNH